MNLTNITEASPSHQKADILSEIGSASAFWPCMEDEQTIDPFCLGSGTKLSTFQTFPEDEYLKTSLLESKLEISEYGYFLSPSPSFLTLESKVKTHIDWTPSRFFRPQTSRLIASLSILVSELLKKSVSELSKKLEAAEEVHRFYASRIEMLHSEAVIDDIPFNETSKSDFWKFIKSTSCIRKGSLFLRDNGNLRAVWSDDEGNHLGIQFFGDSSAQYVVFKSCAGGKVWRDAQRDSLNSIEQLIEKLDLKFLLYA